MNQLQTVLDALETAFDTSWAQEIPLMESAIAIVRQMMQAEPVAFFDKYGELFNEVEKLLPTDTPLYAAPVAVQAVPEEKRTLWECRACGHLHGEKVSSCDCMENGANEYNEWVAAPVAKGEV